MEWVFDNKNEFPVNGGIVVVGCLAGVDVLNVFVGCGVAMLGTTAHVSKSYMDVGIELGGLTLV